MEARKSDDPRTAFERFEALAKRIVAVKKSDLPAEPEKPAKRAKNRHIVCSAQD
jgi:hypothetical protein